MNNQFSLDQGCLGGGGGNLVAFSVFSPRKVGFQVKALSREKVSAGLQPSGTGFGRRSFKCVSNTLVLCDSHPHRP